MNSLALLAISVVTLGAAVAAASLKRLIHAALCLALTYVGVAAFYFLLGAEFVGLVQIFVYVGAVAVLIVFTILLTRREAEVVRGPAWSGIIVALVVLGALLWSILRTPLLRVAAPARDGIAVKQIGQELMTNYVWPLQCVGLLLTAALIGALILVLEERR